MQKKSTKTLIKSLSINISRIKKFGFFFAIFKSILLCSKIVKTLIFHFGKLFKYKRAYITFANFEFIWKKNPP